MARIDIDEILKQRATLLWEAAGRPKGREHEFWARAALEIMAESRSSRPAPQAELRRAG